MNRQLVDYIRRYASQGHPVKQLRNTILQQGWTPVDVDAAISEYNKHPKHTGPSLMPPPKRPSLVTFLGAFGVIGSFLLTLVGILLILMIIVMGSVVNSLLSGFMTNLPKTGILSLLNLFGAFGAGFMILLLISLPLFFGLLGLFANIKLLKMKKIGLILVAGSYAVTILLNVLSRNIFILGNGLSLLLLFYFYKKRELFV